MEPRLEPEPKLWRETVPEGAVFPRYRVVFAFSRAGIEGSNASSPLSLTAVVAEWKR